MESVLCWPSPPGHGACCGAWLPYPETFCRRQRISPFPSRYQVQVASWLLVELCVPSSISGLGFCLVWTRVGLTLTISVCCVWKTGFPWARRVFRPPLPHRSLVERREIIKFAGKWFQLETAEKRDLIGTFYFGPRASKSSTLYTPSSC